ncbi:dephospho-CoA kinase [Lacticaseibacillus nasuensis]|uniref:Dephospho-CoA kinase n=2 Tax=Lacticaseibacillus TaxID=2759736 RepID=A0A0R1JRH2_9LACO|nr:dephospho-CoA kinase [Lacticaseibacillus nasuensis]KRK70833.1 dephospho-CoA kinase [Lacticaseibacillus nasuensis JCM 17158]
MTYRLGLTGGIASGKSTVAAQFRDVGVPVIDADAIAHDLVQPGMPVLAKIVKQFGPTMLRADGQLDRARLAQRVFNDPAALAKLNDLYQPELRDTLTAALASATGPLVVGDIPLLYEGGWVSAFDGVAVVTLPEALQKQRLMARDGLSAAAAQARIAAQLPLADKVARADFVIDNGRGPAVRQAQVAALIAQLRRD